MIVRSEGTYHLSTIIYHLIYYIATLNYFYG